MHDDQRLTEQRITRELAERVPPVAWRGRIPLAVEAGPTLDDLSPFVVGSSWGAPWQTTWFRMTADVPADWANQPGTRIEAEIDLGFRFGAAGFQSEGVLVERRSDGGLRPLHGIHPRRTHHVVESGAGPVELLLEAASNPWFPGYQPSLQGLPETARTTPIYRFKTAQLVLVDVEGDALVRDLEVLDATMRSLPTADRRRAGIRRSILMALDAMPDVAVARAHVAGHLMDLPDPELPAPQRHRIIASGHAHIDTAWLWPMRETIRKCIRTFSSAVALMDDDPAYEFACSQAQQYAWIQELQPELFAKIQQRAERGQWHPSGGMWVEADMNLPSGESLARQIVFGQRYFTEHFGAPCDEMWIPDVFGYPASLPQLFAAGGMTRFVTQKLSWNKQNRFPHHTFWWEGLDGTRVLTHFPPVDTYNAELTPDEIAGSVERFKDHTWSNVSLVPFGYGDGGGGPTRDMLERAHRIGASDPRWTLEIGSPTDFFEALEAEVRAGAPVPVWRGELYFEMHRGTLTSQLRTKVGNRRCERLLVEAELWSASLGRAADVDELWREVLTQQFHDILPGSSIAWVHRDAEEIFERVGAELMERIDALLAELAPGPVCVANPADVAFAGVVVTSHSGVVSSLTQALSDGTTAVWATAPALGLGSVDTDTDTGTDVAPVVVVGSTMSNGLITAEWNREGELVSVVDEATGRQVLPPDTTAAVLELARDHPVEYDAWDLESWTRANGHAVGGGHVLVTDHGPLVGRVEVSRSFGPSTAVVTYELRAAARELLVHVDIDWHHDEHLLSMAFPLDVRANNAACDIQFGVVDRPTHPSTPWDAAKFEVCAHRFVSVSEPSFGVAVLNDGRYGHCVFDGAISVSLARAAKYPDPDADHGRHQVTLALRPHDGDLADVRAAAERLNRPPRVVVGGRADAGAGPVVTLSGDTNVQVDAVKLADADVSTDLVVRLHEAVGDRCVVTIAARSPISEAWRCDLMETRQEEVAVDAAGAVTVTLKPFEIVTVRLRQTPVG